MLDILWSAAGLLLLIFLFSEEFQNLLKKLGQWRERQSRGRYAVYVLAALLAMAGLGLILRFFVRVFSLLFVYE